jgi:hypothetical protein
MKLKPESPSHIGARTELVVSVDLLRQRFSVLRNVSADGPVDLVAIKRRAVFKVQVRTTLKSWDKALRDNNILAVVPNNGPVRYFANRNSPSLSLFEAVEILKKRKKRPAKT